MPSSVNWIYMKKTVLILFMFVIAGITTGAYHLVNRDWVLYRQGERQFAAGNIPAAIAAYEQVRPGKIGVEDRLAAAYLAGGDVTRAMPVLETIRRREPGNMTITTSLADAYVRSGRFAQAASLYREILKKNPEDRRTRIELARVLAWEGQYNESIGEYRKTLKTTGEGP